MLESNIKKDPVIIIPAYCPDDRLVKLINEIRKKVNFPIVVVDDGSGEKYKNIFILAERVNDCLVYSNDVNMGKGAALKNGVKYASIKYPYNSGYITCDADGQHSVKDILAVAKALIENKKSLILGVRDFSLENVPKKSRIGNSISSKVFYLITGKKCYDTQTGLRGIQREYEDIFISEEGNRYEFEMNFLIKIAKKNIEFKEVIIETIYIDNNKASHFRPFKDSVRIFSGLLKYTFSSILSAIIDLSIFTLLYTAIFKGYVLGAVSATVLARIISGIFNFLLNQRWVFKGKKDSREAIKYLTLFILQMLTSGILVSLLTSLILNATLSKIIVDFLLFIISYFIQKNLIFKKR